jgi:TRAP-type C4-dicarboxylate transport system permease small subunit
MLERIGNVIYWLCLVASGVLVIVGIMTFAAIGGQITQTWTIFGGWALVAVATYGVGWLVRFFTFAFECRRRDRLS